MVVVFFRSTLKHFHFVLVIFRELGGVSIRVMSVWNQSLFLSLCSCQCFPVGLEIIWLLHLVKTDHFSKLYCSIIVNVWMQSWIMAEITFIRSLAGVEQIWFDDRDVSYSLWVWNLWALPTDLYLCMPALCIPSCLLHWLVHMCYSPLQRFRI